MVVIDNKKWYSLREVHKKSLIPMLPSEYLLKKWINCGKLKGEKFGRGKATRYVIFGERIIEFKAKWEAGDFFNR